jgi:hypothetical protein
VRAFAGSGEPLRDVRTRLGEGKGGARDLWRVPPAASPTLASRPPNTVSATLALVSACTRVNGGRVKVQKRPAREYSRPVLLGSPLERAGRCIVNMSMNVKPLTHDA